MSHLRQTDTLLSLIFFRMQTWLKSTHCLPLVLTHYLIFTLLSASQLLFFCLLSKNAHFFLLVTIFRSYFFFLKKKKRGCVLAPVNDISSHSICDYVTTHAHHSLFEHSFRFIVSSSFFFCLIFLSYFFFVPCAINDVFVTSIYTYKHTQDIYIEIEKSLTLCRRLEKKQKYDKLPELMKFNLLSYLMSSSRWLIAQVAATSTNSFFCSKFFRFLFLYICHNFIRRNFRNQNNQKCYVFILGP